jgi:hypothetical protein
MKTKILTLFFALFIGFLTNAQMDTYLFPANFAKDGKAGFIDSTGKIVIPYIYDEVKEFSDDLAAVRSGELWGFIDKSGKYIIPAKYTYTSSFSFGVAQVYYEEKYHFINKDGSIFDVQCENYEEFSEGMIKTKNNDLFGFANYSGKTIVPAEYEKAFSYNEGIGYALKDSEWYFFDKQGKLLFKTKYDPLGRYSEGFIQVKIGDKFGFMDKTGKLVIPAIFQFRNSTENLFSDGMAVFQEGSGYYDYKMGCIDKKGKVVIKPTFSLIYPFSNGMAAFSEDKDGYIDKTGKVIIPVQYVNAFEFAEGFAVAIRGLGEGKYQYEILNTKGEIIKTFEAYEGIRESTKFKHGLCKLHQTIPASPDMKDENMRQWGGVKTIYVNKKGEVVWESEPWYSCFPGSEMVLMADFSEKTINQLIIGDEILSLNKETGILEKTIILEIQQHTGNYKLLEIFYSDGSNLTSTTKKDFSSSTRLIKLTENHPIMTISGFKPARYLKTGDEIFIFNSLNKQIEKVKIEKLAEPNEAANNVYNLKLNSENYIVDGVIVMMK